MTYNEDGTKSLTASQLISLLMEVSDTDTVVCNQVGNLLIYRSNQPLYWIDFGEGSVEQFN